MGGSGGGGSTTSIQDVPAQFKPAFTNLYNSAFGAARTAAGQPGFGQAGQGYGASAVANQITGMGGQQANPWGPPTGGMFQNPYQSMYPQPYQGFGPMNTSQPLQNGQQGGAKGGAEGSSGMSSQAGTGLGGSISGTPSVNGQLPMSPGFGFSGPANQAPGYMPPPQASQAPGTMQPPGATRNRGGGAPPGTHTTAPVPQIPLQEQTQGQFSNQGQGAKATPQFAQSGVGAKGGPDFGPGSQYATSNAAGTTGINASGNASTAIPLAAGPPIIGPRFPEQFTAGTSPLEYESLAQQEAIARQMQGAGNSVLNLGQQQARGDFLNAESNPYFMNNLNASLRPITQEFTNSVLPQFNSQAISSGAFGGSSARDMAFNQLASGYGQQMLDTGTGLAFDNYQRERQHQQNAGQLIDQGSLLNQISPQLLSQIGLGQRELAQRPLDEALLQFQESINAPFRPLFPLASIIQGGDIGSTFSTQVPQPSALSSGLVGALGGAGAGSQVAGAFDMGNQGTGWATAIGTLLGGLGGGLG